ncbi:MAG TPA: type I-E CRISPR-associated protein Cas7/Cse4/CasC, partial [Gammaproteobacteria bacterium]|nr:type I-E CRISPR-associated protein Cas7/Cse4/CasC [Gammaproteobacteria bacterium]
GTRTKRLGEQVFERLVQKGASENKAKKWAAAIAGQFGKLKKDSLEIEQLAHVAPEEWEGIEALAGTLAEEDREPGKDELELLRKNPKAVDIALFGRMLASNPPYNVEAATQVAHAITVNQVKIEDDFFTAVDDLNTHEEDAGAGHMGDAGFSSGVFYHYICIDRNRLVENLQADEELANRAIAALTEAAAKVAPTGKQNSFASRAYTSYLLAEKGSQQPRSLSVAFLGALRGNNILEDAVERLKDQLNNFDKVYGDCADDCRSLNALTGEGHLQEIIDFVTE